MSGDARRQQLTLIGFVVVASVGLAAALLSSRKKKKAAPPPRDGDDGGGKKKQGGGGSTTTASRGIDLPSIAGKTDATMTQPQFDEKSLHLKIEELDKQGKEFFKNKQYLEAAQLFTEALDVIDTHKSETNNAAASSLLRQTITLLNNRSAMYEKADMKELALEDCSRILEFEVNHTKARTRKLRILEDLQRYKAALVEVCAIQLLFMRANRENLRMGLPIPQPPVKQTKMEELLTQVVPKEVEMYQQQRATEGKDSLRKLPAAYTILQLLKSYTGYNAWMALAAKDGPVEQITKDLQEMEQQASAEDDAKMLAQKASLLMKRGRRYVYQGEYENATHDFEQAYSMIESSDKKADIIKAMVNDDYARLLEWTGMVKHYHYELEGALECYEKCSQVEPKNAMILVKQAGVQMDNSKQDEAMTLFDKALKLDPKCADAMLHRSNLRMIQNNIEDAKKDLKKCVELSPNLVMARVRYASVLSATGDAAAAKKQLDAAERLEPQSSEVLSYRGELLFAQGEMSEARTMFDKAIALQPNNPTPYVNAAMALLNTPVQPGEVPDAKTIMEYLEKAIEVDPQFTAAYIQLGQLKLGTATELETAKQVIDLYDTALRNCRSTDELRELCSMRTLAVAQVEAASMLGMDTFDMK